MHTLFHGLTLFAVFCSATWGFAAPVPTPPSDEKLKEQALKLNDLTTTAAMDEQFRVISKNKESAKRMVKLALTMHTDAAEKEKPFKFNAAIVLGQVAELVKDYSTSETFFDFCVDNAVKLQSGAKLALAYKHLIQLKWVQKKYNEVEEICQKTLESDMTGKDMESAKVSAIMTMIRAKAMKGDTDEALQMANRFAALDKNEPDLLLPKAFVQRQAGKFDDAISTYEDMLKLVEKSKRLKANEKKERKQNIRYSMTAVYVDAEKVDKAAEILQELIKEDPENPTYHNDLGFIWADHDMKFEESEKLIRKALELDTAKRKKLLQEGKIDKEEAEKQSAAYLDSLGWVLYKTKKYADAKKYLLEAAKDDEEGDHLEIWDHLADVHMALGEVKEAVEIWTKALKLDDVGPRDAERRKKVTEKLKKAKAELKEKGEKGKDM